MALSVAACSSIALAHHATMDSIHADAGTDRHRHTHTGAGTGTGTGTGAGTGTGTGIDTFAGIACSYV